MVVVVVVVILDVEDGGRVRHVWHGCAHCMTAFARYCAKSAVCVVRGSVEMEQMV